MKVQYGARLATRPDGMLREIIFPALAFTDVFTGDRRILEGDGGGSRELPLTIWGQFVNESGHSGAVIVGALHEVTFEDDGVVSGHGWLLDDENGRNAVKYLKTQSMRGNSVDLADVKAGYEWDEEADDIAIRFSEWNIAGTTLVGRPAFKDAHASLGEELVASWMDETDPLVVDLPFSVNVQVAQPEVMASGAKAPSWELFYVPESPTPQPKFVGEPDESGFMPVFGHLGLWNTCHDGIEGQCTIIPRPSDDYRGFNSADVLTDRGMVKTGPLFLAGGHPKAGALSKQTVIEAYGGVENTWADVRITAGALGPWMSGYVRPGTPDDMVVAARASKISGHWLGTVLKAAVSVNVPGYEVSDSFALAADGTVAELVASFPACFGDDGSSEQDAQIDDADDAATEEFDASDLLLEVERQDLDFV